MSNVLLLQEKWADGKPDLGLSNSFHNVLTSYAKTQDDNKFHAIHHDESLFTYGQHVDDFLVGYCSKYSIGIVVIMLLGKSPSNPSDETYIKLKELGIKLCWVWPDSGRDSDYGILKALELSQYGPQIIWDTPKSPFHDSLSLNSNIVKLFVPQDDSFFYPDIQDINVSFVGSTTNYRDREYFLSYATRAIPDFVLRGGQRQEGLGMGEYASIIRRSKIGINFPLSLAQFYQIKGRAYEILASKSCLFEMKNPATESLFQPGIHYVEFERPDELVGKIEYYLENEDERLKIAEAGHNKYMEGYTAKHYWKRVMGAIK